MKNRDFEKPDFPNFEEFDFDYFLVELYNVVGHGLSSPFRMCVATSFYQRPASRVYFFAVFNLRNLLDLLTKVANTSVLW